jgi:putative resolvase
VKLSEFARRHGIHYNTAYRMWRRGELPGKHYESGFILIDEQVDAPRVEPSTAEARTAVCARVSSSENRTNLNAQAERVLAWCTARGWSVHRVVKECGSGINDERRQFHALLKDRSITRIVVEHKDRASRFSVAYLETLLAGEGRELVIVNEAEAGDSDLMEDFAAIVTSVTARLYGRRRARRTTERVLAALREEAE